MRFSIQREILLKPLQSVVGVIERRQTMAILSNVLLKVSNNTVAFTATDMEIEMLAIGQIDSAETGDITVPARKFYDICRALPEGAQIDIDLNPELQRLTIRSGKSRFNLTTLPAADFPSLKDIKAKQEFKVPQAVLKRLIETTHFAMAQQDVRYYLNGLLLELVSGKIRTVATDGHRLAYSEQNADIDPSEPMQVILPRKGVLELAKLLEYSNDVVDVSLSANHIRVQMDQFRFTSKLVDGRYPDYQGVIPSDGDRVVTADRLLLKDAMTRAAILSNEKFRGIRVKLSRGLMQMTAHNPEREEAEEELEIDFTGADLETGFNVNYLLDALSIIHGDNVEMTMGGHSNSCVVKSEIENGESLYVIMPMKL